MKLMLGVSFILNLIIIISEVYVFSKLKKKVDIIKYYTFLQNFIALIVSIISLIYLSWAIFFNGEIPEYVRGIRYVATCGLISTMFIYVVFLSANKNNLLDSEDFILDFNPERANFILHYFCPIISLISFIVFERTIVLTQAEWTGYVAIPSCLYWIMYLFLSLTKLWDEPYDFVIAGEKKQNKLLDVLIMICIPITFIFISYILWIIR